VRDQKRADDQLPEAALAAPAAATDSDVSVAAMSGAQKLRRLEAITDAALSRLDLDDLLTELLERTRDLLGVDTATIMLVDPSGKELVATATVGLEEEIRTDLRIPIGEGFTGRVAALAQPLTLDHVDSTSVVSRFLIDKHVTSMLGVPMLAAGAVIGVLHIGSTAPRQYSGDDIELLQLVADRAAMAAQARLAELDRATTLALQRSLLPARPPKIPGLDVAVRYIPGAQVGVGGDWYDLFQLPSGHIGEAIGDVAGNGLRAAVVMGRIRSALRAYALETDDPADVLSRLDRKIQRFEPDAMATAIYAVIAPDLSTVTVSLAGHLPPAVIAADGHTSLFEAPTDLPLGAYPDAPRRGTTEILPVGSSVFLYTDGLVERRDRRLTDGLALLLATLGAQPAEELCSHATAALLDHEQANDDVAILVIRRRD